MSPMPSRQMAASGMAGKAETRGISSPFFEMGNQEIDCLTNLADDSANACFRCERIFDERHVEAVCEGAGGNLGKLLLGEALPITPVNVGKGRRPDARAGNPVYSLARNITIGQVSLNADTLVDRSAATTEIGHRFRHIRHRRDVVVGTVERLAIHAPIAVHSSPHLLINM